MKPIYKYVTDFNNFFNFIHFEIIQFIIGPGEILYNEAPDIFGQHHRLPGIYIKLNGIESSFTGYRYSDESFERFFATIKKDILNEFQGNIESSTSNKELKDYHSKVKSVLNDCEKNIIEVEDKTKQEVHIKYTYRNSSITRKIFDTPEYNELSIDKFSEEPAEECLSTLLHWIKVQVQSLLIDVDKSYGSVKPIVIALKSVKSFEFKKPQYYPSRIPYVFNDLRDNDFIDKETHPDQLQAVFKNTQITQPVKWIAKKANLYCFVKQLIKKGIIIDPGKEIWKKTVVCFVDENGGLLKPDDLRGSKQTKKASMIESIVRKFLN